MEDNSDKSQLKLDHYAKTGIEKSDFVTDNLHTLYISFTVNRLFSLPNTMHNNTEVQQTHQT